MDSAGRPVIAGARDGGNSRIRSRNASQPTCGRSMNSPILARLRRARRAAGPSASAASVPGIGARCQSLAAAVRVRIGSMATTSAPFFRASRIGRHRCGCVDSTFAPQSTTSFEKRGASPGPCRRGCRPACSRCRTRRRSCRSSCTWRDAPSTFQQPASGAVDALEQPHAAAAEVGPDRLGAVRRDRLRAAASRSGPAPRPMRCG